MITISDGLVSKLIIGIAAGAFSVAGSTILKNSNNIQKNQTELAVIKRSLDVIECGVFKQTPLEQLECIGEQSNR